MPDTTKRESLNGAWKLDKTKGEPSMRRYLETMGVSELAIVAHEKGEAEVETINIIQMSDEVYKIKKMSRINKLVEEFEIAKDTKTKLSTGEGEKTTLIQSNGPSHVCVTTIMPTMNGVAKVVDVKELVEMEDMSFPMMMQSLTITNQNTQKTSRTKRYFIPIDIDEVEHDEER